MNQDKNVPLSVYPTDEEIALIKAKNPSSKLKQVEIPKLGKVLVFKSPDRNTLSVAISAAKSGSQLDGSYIQASNCLVWGDATLLDDIEVLLSVIPVVDSMVEEYELSIKNL